VLVLELERLAQQDLAGDGFPVKQLVFPGHVHSADVHFEFIVVEIAHAFSFRVFLFELRHDILESSDFNVVEGHGQLEVFDLVGVISFFLFDYTSLSANCL
jgi:hypothetical protein